MSPDEDPRLMQAATRLRRIFQLAVPDSPGLFFCGGEADPALLDPLLAGLPVGSLAGSGLSSQRAFASCVGEGVEYLSQFARTTDRTTTTPCGEANDAKDEYARHFVASLPVANGSIDWISTERLADAQRAWFPADLCLRRASVQRNMQPPLKLSTGCAAGPTFESASLRAVLELIERDAVALWWRGGRRARPIAAAGEAGQAAARLIADVRLGQCTRESWLLDITTDLEVPVVAAISTDLDGTGCAFGFGCRLSLGDAACAAIFEMCQAELGRHVVLARRGERGDARLNENDKRILRRGTLAEGRRCELLWPEGDPVLAAPAVPAEPEPALRYLVDRLDAMGIVTYRLDLTREDFTIPVVRALAPRLQLEPCDIVSERLARTIDETGGGAIHSSGIALL